MKRVKLLLRYWFEIGVGALLVWWVEDVRWFLFYAFVIVLWVTAYQTDYLRKLIRVFQTLNEMKLLGIMQRLGITPEEGQALGDEVESNLTEEQRRSLYQDMDDLGLK